MVEPDASFMPPFCPNPQCKFHRDSMGWRFKKNGTHPRQFDRSLIQRYLCQHCRRSFSSQTFSTTYWQKRPGLMKTMFMLVVGCMANRQIARALGCSPTTVAHQLARLGRHCLLYQSRELARAAASNEIVIDGFESFEWSQYYPFHHNVAVEVDTGYFVYHTDSELRRKGRMTEHQKRRRVELEFQHGRPSPREIEVGVRELLEVTTLKNAAISIRSDDHRAYPRAMRGIDSLISHSVTSSKRRRDDRNPLWEVNVLDLMIRHSTAAHKRETIAWAKRRQVSAEKLAIFQVWRNYIKRRWEKGPKESAAMLKGLAHRLLTIEDILKRRLFPWRIDVPQRWRQYYERKIETRALPVNRVHALIYAF
jgi:transposase-like protein